MNLTELKTDFETIINNMSLIKTFVFDDLFSINIDRDKDYPVFLLKPAVTSRIPKLSDPYENYDIDFFIFDLFKQDTYKTLSEAWDDLKEQADLFVTILYDNPAKYMIVGEINIERGHFQHNDSLAGVRYQFELKVFDCRE